MSIRRPTARILLLALLPLMLRNAALAVPSFSSGFQTGNIQNASVNEASGIVASRLNANVLWTHDDSGNPAQIFSMTAAGANLGTYSITGATNIDWEDIAVGPGPVGGSQYLYIGDIGDNNAVRSTISVYRVPEPEVSDTEMPPLSTSLSGAVKFTFAYPDGPRDAESMFVDPLTKDLYIISRRENPKHLYRAAYPQSTSGTTTLELMTTFLTDSTWLTAADISLDGNEIIVRSTGNTSGRMYVRPPGGSITDAFNAAPIIIPLATEAQGEAIGFDPFGWGYFTTSEGVGAPIRYFNRLPPPAGTLYWDNDTFAAGSYLATGAGMGGTGSWDTSAKWYNGSADIPWSNGNNAVFWGAAGTVTLSAAQTVNSLTFKTSGYTLTASTLTLAGSSITVDSGMTATINSTVAGTVGLIKNGNGTLNLSHANNYTGVTTINAGVLGIVSNALGAIPVSPTTNIIINNGATLRFNVNGLTVSVNRQLVLGSGGGKIDTNGNTDTIAGAISGTTMTKSGAGTLILTNANSYTGGTTISAGTLLVMNSTGSGTGSGVVDVNAGASLGGNGTIQGNVTSSGTLAPGNSIGTLDIGGSYTQAAGARLEIELASASSDKLAITGVASLAGTLAVSLTGGFVPQQDDVFEIVTASGFGGTTFTNVSPLPALSGDLTWNLNYGATTLKLSVVLLGDFNHDGLVDAADYIAWQKTDGTPAGYDEWRTHYGDSAGGGAASNATPEPGSIVLLLAGMLAIVPVRRKFVR